MTSERDSRLFANHFTQVHGWILAIFLLTFGMLTWGALRGGSASDVRERPIVLATLSTPLGPMVGAIARNGQRCCLDCSLWLLPYCAVSFLAGAAVQFVRLPFGRFSGPLRLLAWIGGLFGWFAGIPLSLMHALS